MKRALVWVMLLAVPLSGQEANKKQKFQAHPKVDQKKVDAAIRNGVEFLRKQITDGAAAGGSEELVLWTLVKAGPGFIPESDKDFQALLKGMLESELAATYNVSLQALILEEMDRVKYQPRIWQCGQFLVDNQGPRGFFSYGAPTTYPKMPTGVPTGGRKKVATSGTPSSGKGASPRDPHLRVKPDVLAKIPVKKQRDGAETDNSNAQYAALGLRACHDAGIDFPKEVIQKFQKWWRENQVRGQEGDKGGNVATEGGNYPAYGWCYCGQHPAYGSMTVGAIGGLAICDYILGESWMGDKWVNSGLAWMAKNFTVKENPGPPEHGSTAYMHYYYLYGMERAGMLYGTEFFGRHEWYPAGAEFLLKEQQGDGSWISKPNGHENAVWDTCWAILFLRRGTRPLNDVASTDGRVPVPQEAPPKPAEPRKE